MRLLKKTQSIIITPIPPITFIINKYINSKFSMNFIHQLSKKIEKPSLTCSNYKDRDFLKKRKKYIEIKCPVILILEHFELIFL